MTNLKIYLIVFTLWGGILISAPAQIRIGATIADTSTLVSNLDTPWEILWGPDEHIWITERNGKVSRLNPD
jgi:aldose sugar dehydrogenase